MKPSLIDIPADHPLSALAKKASVEFERTIRRLDQEREDARRQYHRKLIAIQRKFAKEFDGIKDTDDPA